MTKRTANLVCLLVAVIWGAGFLATRWCLDSVGPFYTMLFRFWGAAVLAWLQVGLGRRKVRRKAVTGGLLCGLFMYAAFAFQTLGLERTTAGMNAFLTSVNVVLVPWIAYVWLKCRPGFRQVLASLLCLAGVGVLSLNGTGGRFGSGDWLTLVCAVFFALQIVGLSGCRHEDAVVVNAVQLAACALLSLPFALFLEPFPVQMSGLSAVSVFYSAVVSTWLAFWLQTWAQKHTDAASAGILLSTESLWANVFAVLILHEPFSVSLGLGGGLILLSVFLSS